MTRKVFLKKNVLLIIFFSVIGLAIGSTLWVVSWVESKACVQNLVKYNAEPVETGTFTCFSGGYINKASDNLGALDTEEIRVLDFLVLTGTPSDLIAQDKVDLTGINKEQAPQYIKSMNSMWVDIKDKKFLFFASYDDVEKYIFSGVFKGQRITFQVEFVVSENAQHKLRLIRSKDQFSKLLARWHVYSSSFSDDQLYISFWDRLNTFLTYKKVCPASHYCFYYKNFNYYDTASDSNRAVWDEFLSAIKSQKYNSVSKAMDANSLKNLGIANSEKILREASIPVVDWMSQLTPVAVLDSGPMLVFYVREPGSINGNEKSYNDGESAPLLFYRDPKEGRYVAIGMNKIDSFVEFLKSQRF